MDVFSLGVVAGLGTCVQTDRKVDADGFILFIRAFDLRSSSLPEQTLHTQNVINNKTLNKPPHHWSTALATSWGYGIAYQRESLILCSLWCIHYLSLFAKKKNYRLILIPCLLLLILAISSRGRPRG